MAIDGKRSLPPKIEAMRARKRLKLNAQRDASTHPQLLEDGPERPHVNLDELVWKEVPLPDRMDDYEGFFGLEEIDGVDVIRNGHSGKVQYSTKRISATSSKQVQSTEPDIQMPQAYTTADDWLGFNEAAKSGSVSLSTNTAARIEEQPASILKKVPPPTSSNGENGCRLLDFNMLEEETESGGTDVSAWRDLNLSSDIMVALSRLSFSVPTTIQRETIPAILQGQDVIGKASTGSGKTLAFGLPVIDCYLERQLKSNQKHLSGLFALILSPTRELAHQLEKHLVAVTAVLPNDGPSIACLTGGLSIQKQQRLLRDADIIIATPGRLWELIGTESGLSKALKSTRFLVIDEADRLLSEGHFKEVEHILNVLDREDDEMNDVGTLNTGIDNRRTSESQQRPTRQTLVFSATFDKSLQTRLSGRPKLGDDVLSTSRSMEYLMSKVNFNGTPQLIDVNPVRQLASGLREGLIECGGLERDLYLYSILLHHPKERIMVFANSISAVRRLTPFLQNLDLPALALHSGMPQKARLRSVERLAKASAQHDGAILVATDVAARGLDIPDVQLVVHYDFPRAANVYIHRSGRTARAGNTGSSIIMCFPEVANDVRKLIAGTHALFDTAHGLSTSKAKKQAFFVRTMDPDRKLVARLKPRVTLAKRLADVVIAKEKRHKEEDFLHAAAEELGVDYDSDEFQKEPPGRSGRGSGRRQKEKLAQAVSKAEAAGLRAELRRLLDTRVNAGVSEKYITSGKVDVADLLAQQENGSKTGEFVGTSSGFRLDAL